MPPQSKLGKGINLQVFLDPGPAVGQHSPMYISMWAKCFYKLLDISGIYKAGHSKYIWDYWFHRIFLKIMDAAQT